MEPERVPCRNWNEFRTSLMSRLFANEPFVRGRFLFRGQRDSRWQLKSSYDRWFDAGSFPEAARVDMAEKLVARFAKDLPGLQLNTGTRAELLALAQHYSLPTRLLDWTESPYVAAFFAFSGALESGAADAKPTVYALDTRSYAWQGRGVSVIRTPPGENSRLRNQEGCFTLLESVATSLEDHLAALPAEEPWPLYQFTIPAQDAIHALSELDVMGITASRLYPDLQGYAWNAKLSVLIERSVGRAVGPTRR